MTVSGPMFELAESRFWKSNSGRTGAHYNMYSCKDSAGMDALRELFPDGKAYALNFVLFSTSGVHGSYRTIEEVKLNDDALTFVVIQPRICCLRYGNCQPKTLADKQWLKDLRTSSHAAVQTIGI